MLAFYCRNPQTIKLVLTEAPFDFPIEALEKHQASIVTHQPHTGAGADQCKPIMVGMYSNAEDFAAIKQNKIQRGIRRV